MSKQAKASEFKPGQGFTKEDWDAVESPPATDEQLAKAKPFAEVFPDLAATMSKGGRPKLERPKQALSIRLDQDVIEHFKASGDGWQSRMNEALRKVAGL